MAEFFTDVTQRIPYVGPESDEPLAFHWYDADRVVAGRRMEDHLRFAACYWHSFNWDGFDIFGSGTLDRPWHPTFAPGLDPLEAARWKMETAFEFFAKLGVPFYCFHDRDIAPEGASFKESAALLDEMVDLAAGHQERTGVTPLWGTANLFTNPRYQAGAATNPDPEVFAYAAAQVTHCLDATHRLGGHNYVLWGGREGYDTLLNTDLRRELDQLGRFLTMVVEHKHSIGFTGTILIEPKPFCSAMTLTTRSRSTSRSTTPRWRATTSPTRSPSRPTPGSSARSTPTPATTGWAGTSTGSRSRSNR
jgi:xylose isomerase